MILRRQCGYLGGFEWHHCIVCIILKQRTTLKWKFHSSRSLAPLSCFSQHFPCQSSTTFRADLLPLFVSISLHFNFSPCKPVSNTPISQQSQHHVLLPQLTSSIRSNPPYRSTALFTHTYTKYSCSFVANTNVIRSPSRSPNTPTLAPSATNT